MEGARIDEGLRARRFAVLAPMRPELRPLLRPLGLRRASSARGGLYEARGAELEVVAAITGIGPRAAEQATRRVLDAARVDHVLVVGIAGGIGPAVAIGDLVVPERVVDLRTEAEYRPTPLGSQVPRGVLATSEAVLADAQELARLAARGVIAVDMETAAVAAVCEARGCPWSVFRGISDRADDGSVDPAVLALAGPDGSGDPAAVAAYLLRRPWRIAALVRLSRGTRLAAATAADAALRALQRPAESG